MVEKYESDINSIVIISKLLGQKSCIAKSVLRWDTSWLNSSRILMVFTILSLFSVLVRAKENSIVRFLGGPVKEAEAITYSIKGDTDLLISFIRATDKPIDVELYVTNFVGEQGDNLTVTPVIVELPNLKAEGQNLKFTFRVPVMTLKLKVPEIPTTGKYVGNLVISKDGQVQQTQQIVLTRLIVQNPVQLGIETKLSTIYYTKPFLWWTLIKELPSFTVFVRNSNSEWQAKDIFLRLLEVTAPEGANFDPEKNLTFTWNGQKAGDLWRSPSPQDTNAMPHVIPPNNQAVIGGEFHNLVPGEYTLKLGLASANTTPQAEDQMEVKVHVRDSIVRAIVILLLAIALSFIATKGVDGLRRRLAVLKKISELKLPFLREDTAHNVSVRAILKQVEDHNKNWFNALFGPDVVSDRVDKAERMIGILHRVHQIREHISNWDEHIMITYRLQKYLREVIEDMAPETVNEEYVTESKRKLDDLEEWITTDKLKLCRLYWEDVKNRAERLLCQAKPDEFSDTKHKNVVNNLCSNIDSELKDIEQNPSKLNLEKATKIDENYARLKVLWKCKQNDDIEALNSLVDLLDTDPSYGIIGFFKERDKIAWKGLKSASNRQGTNWLTFTSPQNRTVDPTRAYELIQFKVESIPRDLGNNYLFENELDYHWDLDLETETRSWWGLWKKKTETKKLTKPRTKEPRLVQYVPRKGKLHASVRLFYNNEDTPKVSMRDALTVDKAKDFGWIRSLRFVEITALVIAALFAVISGLKMFYIGKPNFGSMADYVTLFIWGAGIDQTKNFIQHLAQSSTAKGTSS